ncbi:MAG TPA: molybdenum cofactor guanylyltransferase [Vicinamibacterales bacterium]|nr:molybdenum cofactor guanylyltransferase [Vicinamibacterales bacterium]
MWTGAILAGGRARRLGGLNKAGLVLHPGSASLLDRQLTRLSHVVDRTIIIANDADRFTAAGVPVIADLVPEGGALGALYTAVHAAPTDRTLVVACDMPFLSEPLFAHLVAVGHDVDIAIPLTARGYEPLCATYSRRCAAELRRLIDEKRYRLSDVARIPGLNVREIGRDELKRFGPAEVLFFNLNTPDDHARAIDLDGEYHYPS